MHTLVFGSDCGTAGGETGVTVDCFREGGEKKFN